jgi:hypothetical protein
VLDRVGYLRQLHAFVSAGFKLALLSKQTLRALTEFLALTLELGQLEHPAQEVGVQQSSFLRPGLDPGGIFNAWNSLSFAMTALLVMMAFVLLDFWPLSSIAARVEAMGKQPAFGIVATLCALLIAWLIWAYFVLLQNMDPVVYMVRVPVSIIFGEFIVLVMMRTAPVQNTAQPLKGIILIGIAVLLSFVMYALYSWASQILVGDLPVGPPGYQLDLWLASAMLAVTFPIFVLYADLFGY